eukprot:CAMPEP_0114235072 /NCGR_PEP_ID=MMETSP0058-20121206/6047_1 /TAXON_ID=36894 /ORGANISM="Pyramimonas parkeae, CCMP726" /LENGTH=125 /DNA_ID=CAMNT_0001346793 /DNA_START=145 /DNA_END=522 /DNA_ORIENTATION=+
MSLKALDAPASSPQWVTYWIVHALCTSLELTAKSQVNSLWMLKVLKLALCVWMAFPKFNGALTIYKIILKRMIAPSSSLRKPAVSKQKTKNIDQTPMEVLSKADRFLKANGYSEPRTKGVMGFSQ